MATQVLAAAALKFKTPVDAPLWMPAIDFPCLIGRVYMDLSGRFQDGRLIRTSEVMRLTEEDGGTIARTFAGSHYLLVQVNGNAFLGLIKLQLASTEPNGFIH